MMESGEILWCCHSNETSSAVLSHSTIYSARSSNFWVCGWNPWCDHLNETSSAVLSHGTIYSVCGSKFWVCGWNPIVLPFKWNLFSTTFTWYFFKYVVLTFESVDQILWCDHSNETSSAVLSHGTIYSVCGSNFWVCGWNPMVLPFKWNFFGGTFTWYFTRWSLKFCWSLTLATFGSKRVNIVRCFCRDSP